MTYAMINLQDHANFNSIEELNETVRQFNATISRSHFETLSVIARHSVKVLGVSRLKLKTIAALTNKSIATIKRHIAYFKAQGILTVINTTRIKSGGKGSNIYRINSVSVREKIKNELSKMSHRKQSKKDAKTLSQQAMAFVLAKKETMYYKAIKILFLSTRHRKRQQTSDRIDAIKNARICPPNVPNDVYMSYKAFFTDEQIAVMYRSITNKLKDYVNLTDEQHNDVIDSAFKYTVKALRDHYKHDSEPVRNIFAYSTRIADKTAAKHMMLNNFGYVL